MKTNKILSVILLVLVNTNASVVSILGRDYWKSTLLVENNLPAPNWIQHSASETLLFMNRETLRFTGLNFTMYKILPASKKKTTFGNILDKNGNSIMNVNGYLVYSTKNLASSKMVESKDHKVFKDFSLDINRCMAYMIGVDHADSSGRLFVFNSSQPTTTDHQVLLEDVSQLGSRIKCLSVDQVTGNVVLIEVFEDTSWKMILLADSDFRLIFGIPRYSEEFVKMYNISHSQYQYDFNVGVDKIMDTIISLSAETCRTRTFKLQIENQRLRHQILSISRLHRHFQKKSNLKFDSIDDAFLTDTSDAVDKRNQKKMTLFAKNAGRNITNMLHGQNVMWLDDVENVGSPECGEMFSDLDYYPWTVSILQPPFPYTFICYGTLIHPKVVILSSLNILGDGELIARSGVFNPSSAGIDIQKIDRKILKRIKVSIGTILLVEKFSEMPGRRPACLTKAHSQWSKDMTCFGLEDYKSRESDIMEIHPSAIMTTQEIFSINTQCGSRMHNDAIYCKSVATERIYLFGILMSNSGCSSNFFNVDILGRSIIESLAKENIIIRPLL